MNRIIDNTFRGIKRNMYICCDIKKIFDFDYKKMRKIIYILIYVFVSYSFLFEGFQSVYANQNDEMVTVTLYSNYPVDCGMEDTTQTTSGYYEVSLSMNSNGLTCDGYTFLGWNEDKDDAEFNVQYNSYDIISFNKTTNLYACWRKNITITYDAGEGKFANGSTVIDVKTYANKYNYTSIIAPVKDDAVFIGWFVPGTSVEGDSSTYISNSSACSFRSENSVVLTAKYSSEYYVITLDANGGTFGTSTSTGQQVGTKVYRIQKKKSFYDSYGSGPSNPYWLPSDEKGFIGWVKKGDNEGDIIYSTGSNSISSTVFSENTEYVAVWGDYHTVTFDAADGYFKSGSSKIKTKIKKVIDGKKLYTSDVPAAFNDDEKMIFKGWKKAGETGGKVYKKDELSNIKVLEDTIYEAVWLDSSNENEMEGYVKISFDAGEGFINNIYGSETNSESASYIVEKGLSVYDSYEIYVSAIRTGYSLKGWKLEGDTSGKLYNYFEASKLTCESNVTFVAQWVASHTITFDLGENHYSEFGDSRYITTTVGENECVYSPLSGTNDGYIKCENDFIVGWKCDVDNKVYSGTCLTNSQGDNYIPYENTTFTAVWEEGCKVTFYSPEGCLEGFENTKKVVLYSPKGYPLNPFGSINFYVPRVKNREGYSFKGWKEEGATNNIIYLENYSGGTNSDAYIYKDLNNFSPNGDVTFVIEWDTAYNVYFSSEEGYIKGVDEKKILSLQIGNNKTISSNYPTCFGRANAVFKGWRLEGDETGTLYVNKTSGLNAGEASIQNYVVTKEVTFIAVWNIGHTVTFYSEEGYISGTKTNKEYKLIVEDGKTFTLSSYYYPQNRPGYVFAGWKIEGDTSADIYEKQYSETEGISKNLSNIEITSNLKFYAVWDEAVTVTYNSEAGYISGYAGRKQLSYVVRKGSKIGSKYYSGYGRADYTFIGWKIDGGDGTLYVQSEKDAINGAKYIRDYIPTEDVTFNLVWTSYKTVTIRSEEGYVNGSAYQKTANFQKEVNEKLSSIPTEAKASGRPNYSVKGYRIQGDETGTLYVENINEYTGQDKVKSIYDYVVENDVTFLVQWMTGYEVKFESTDGFLNGKKSDTEMMVSVSSESGGKIKTFPSPSREDYLFKGFVIKDTESGSQGSETDSKTVYVLNSNEAVGGKVYLGDYEVTKSVTFKALWEKDFAKLLKAAKDNAKAQLDEYAESKKLADATEAETKTYNEAVSTGKKIIDTAAVEDEIDSKLAEAKGKIDDVIVSIKVARQKAEDEKNNQEKNNEAEKTTTAPGSSNNNTQPKTTQSTKKPKPVVKKKQTIKAKSKKLYYSDKAVSLGVKTNGNGKLTFKSSNPKVIKIAKNGKVKTVGLGKATITIKAAGTSKFKPATKKITVTVVCAKQVIKSKIQWGNRVKLSWVKDKTVDGYEVQFSIDKKFDEKKTIHNFFKKNVNSTLIKPNGNYTRTYYVRVRSYRIVKGKKVFNDWSKTCTVNLN